MTNLPIEPSGASGRERLSEIADALSEKFRYQTADLSKLNFRRNRILPESQGAFISPEAVSRPDFSPDRDLVSELYKLRALQAKSWAVQARIAALDARRGDEYALALDDLGRSLARTVEGYPSLRDEIQTAAYAELRLAAVKARKAVSEAVFKEVLRPGESEFSHHGSGWGIRSSAKLGKEGEVQILTIIQDRGGKLNAVQFVDRVENKLRAVCDSEVSRSEYPMSVEIQRIFPASVGGGFITLAPAPGKSRLVEVKARFLVSVGKEYL